MKQYVILGVFIIAFTGLITGCNGDDGPTGPGPDGLFTFTIAGDISKSLSGSAWFWSGTVEGESGFTLWLFSDDDNDEDYGSLWFARMGTTRPGTGQYVIANYESWDEENWNPAHFMAWYSDDAAYAWSVSGSINITASATNRVTANFQLQASGYLAANPENEINISISGEVDAVGTDFNF